MSPPVNPKSEAALRNEEKRLHVLRNIERVGKMKDMRAPMWAQWVKFALDGVFVSSQIKTLKKHRLIQLGPLRADGEFRGFIRTAAGEELVK